MEIGRKLREIREAKKLSQGDIEDRTGLIRCYTSQVENGHIMPRVDTLERYASGLEVPLYKFFYDGREPPNKRKLPAARSTGAIWGAKSSEWRELRRFAKALSRMDDRHRRLLLGMAQQMASRKRA